ncbi:MAG: rhomboid family intramembrane serine protease [Oscillatoriales cyanobacterium]|nr:MAG: rhomboid family intramembrane serine protease [Oscillatoriales cyanobacterium]
MNQRPSDDLQALSSQARLLGSIVGIFWILELVDQFVLRGFLDHFGVIPRNLIGLRGIVFAPFLHGDLPHLMANTVPFCVLGWLILVRGRETFLQVSVFVALVSGLGTWIVGPSNSIHIGASGLVFGYLGYLMFRGWFERSASGILLSMFIVGVYGSLIFGVLPLRAGVSWQMHLFGFIGGAIAARYL